MSDINKKARMLFLAIGTVDDRFVAETMQPPSKKRLWQKPYFIVSASAAAVLFITVLGVLCGNAFLRFYRFASMPEEVKSHISLQQTLDKAEDSALRVSLTEVELFNGVGQIIWQNEDNDDYYVIKLDGDIQPETLESYCTPSQMELDPAVNDGASVWISFGDGRVITPYLKESSGNVGYGALFDYEPEVYPEYYSSDMVKNLIESQK